MLNPRTLPLTAYERRSSSASPLLQKRLRAEAMATLRSSAQYLEQRPHSEANAAEEYRAWTLQRKCQERAKQRVHPAARPF